MHKFAHMVRHDEGVGSWGWDAMEEEEEEEKKNLRRWHLRQRLWQTVHYSIPHGSSLPCP